MNQTTLYTPNYVQTFTGIILNLIDPQLDTIFPTDIAVGLARECRFHGGSKRMYSVAEHSVWCANMAEEKYPDDKFLPFKVLLHDAHEGYLKDVPSPLKKLIPRYEEIAQKLQQVIHRRFSVSLTHEDRERIDIVDKMALKWEWENKVLCWKGLPPLSEKGAVDYFIHHFVRLCKAPFVLQP